MELEMEKKKKKKKTRTRTRNGKRNDGNRKKQEQIAPTIAASACDSVAVVTKYEYDDDNHLEYEEAPWKILGSYFEGQHLKRLVRHQIESYNDFVNNQLERTIQMFNPVTIASDQDFDKRTKNINSILKSHSVIFIYIVLKYTKTMERQSSCFPKKHVLEILHMHLQ